MNQSFRNQLTEVLGIEPKQKVARRRTSKKRNNQKIINNVSQKSLEDWISSPKRNDFEGLSIASMLGALMLFSKIKGKKL